MCKAVEMGLREAYLHERIGYVCKSAEIVQNLIPV